jgi:pimeloyl-ACP methyl ester carboxylesterase
MAISGDPTEVGGCPIDHRHVDGHGIRLHVAQAGPEDGPLVVLLHGFPEFWYGWQRQIPGLAAAGYRVWAVDQRGYNTSDKPPGVKAYALDTLAADIVGVIDAAGRDRAHVIGHDWGGVVAWRLAEMARDRLDRVAILNVPHPLIMQRRLRRDPRQLLRSWYMFMFPIPWLPEAWGRSGNWAAMVNGMRGSARPDAFTDEDFHHYRRAWSQPGAYSAMINWYRAALRHPPRLGADQRIDVPTLLLWGVHDRFIGREAAPESIARCDHGRLVTFDNATHWVQHEEVDEVNRLLREWLACRTHPIA